MKTLRAYIHPTVGVCAEQKINRNDQIVLANQYPHITSVLMRQLCVLYFFSQIYQCELEQVPEFGNFREWLLTFDLYRGKKADDFSDDESRIVGKFKVNNS